LNCITLVDETGEIGDSNKDYSLEKGLKTLEVAVFMTSINYFFYSVAYQVVSAEDS
jgi:hypothetical protein